MSTKPAIRTAIPGWVACTPLGKILLVTFDSHRQGARYALVEASGLSWVTCKARGYTLRRAMISLDSSARRSRRSGANDSRPTGSPKTSRVRATTSGQLET